MHNMSVHTPIRISEMKKNTQKTKTRRKPRVTLGTMTRENDKVTLGTKMAA